MKQLLKVFLVMQPFEFFMEMVKERRKRGIDRLEK